MSCNKAKNLPLHCAGLATALAFPASAQAVDAPSRKEGLWEITTNIEEIAHALVVKQCVDAATDPLMQSTTGPFSPSLCTREVKKTESGMIIDSRCSLHNKSGSAHAVVSGSFDDSYKMTVTSEGGGLFPLKMTIEAKWLGACTAGQLPGDVIMGNGARINILELQKRVPRPADPGKAPK